MTMSNGVPLSDSDPPRNEETYEEGAENHDVEAEHWNDKGNLYLSFYDYLTASSCFEMALRTNPGSPWESLYIANLSTAQFRLGLYENAIVGFTRAIELAPTCQTHYLCLGKSYLRCGGHEEEALAVLVQAVEIEQTPAAMSLYTKAQDAVQRKATTG
ncbi:unnamed protein product, partial [Choristocarpus tenellus]